MKKEIVYKYRVVLNHDEEKDEINPIVRFTIDPNDYGNGCYMMIDGAGLGFMNCFDCRYDKRLKLNDLSGYAEMYMEEELFCGSWRIIELERLDTIE